MTLIIDDRSSEKANLPMENLCKEILEINNIHFAGVIDTMGNLYAVITSYSIHYTKLYDSIKNATPDSEIFGYQIQGSRKYNYEKMKEWPA